MLRFILINCCLVAVLLLTGCVTIPAQQMSDARQALRLAQEAGADQYAANEYNQAVLVIKDADRFLEEGRYELAGKVAKRARMLALKARKQALEARAEGKAIP